MEDRQEPDLPRPEPQDEPSLPTPEPPRDAGKLPKPAEAAPPAVAESEEAALPAGQAPTTEAEGTGAPEGAEEAAPQAPEAETEAADEVTAGMEEAGVPAAAEEVGLPSEFGVDEPVPEEEPVEATEEEAAEEEPVATEPVVVEAVPAVAPVDGDEPPAAPKKPPPWGWIIGIGCGCGCLVILVTIAIPALLGYLVYKEESAATTQDGPMAVEMEQSDAEDSESAEGQSAEGEDGEEGEALPDDLSEFDISLQGGDGDGEGDPDGAGLRNAVIFAQQHKPGWTVQVTSHENGWTTVHMVAGPSENALTTWLQLSWDEASGEYELVNEAPLPSDDGGRPGIYTPGEEVAKEAALLDYPDWVAKVDRHSSDWKTAVVWVGPPESEWVAEIRLRWDAEKDCYEVMGEAHIPYGDEEE